MRTHKKVLNAPTCTLQKYVWQHLTLRVLSNKKQSMQCLTTFQATTLQNKVNAKLRSCKTLFCTQRVAQLRCACKHFIAKRSLACITCTFIKQLLLAEYSCALQNKVLCACCCLITKLITKEIYTQKQIKDGNRN